MDLSEETKKMREHYATSDVAKFITQHPNEARALRTYVNQIHSTAMSLSGKIQLELAQNQDGENFAALYKAKEADYIALRFCIEHHKFYNDVAIPIRLNAQRSLTYVAAANKCDAAPLQDFLNGQKEMTQIWRLFTQMVDKGILVDEAKETQFQDAYTSNFTIFAQQELAKYKVMLYSKPLGTGFFQGPNTSPASPETKKRETEDHGLPLLPVAPFKHDETEMKAVALHVKALVDRMNVNDKTGFIVETCRPLFESTKYNQSQWPQCARTVRMIGKRQVQNTKATDAFYSFSIQYQRSARDLEMAQRAIEQNNTKAENLVAAQHNLPPLPDSPFKHDEPEMKGIILHMEALLDRLNVDDNAAANLQTCHEIMESHLYTQSLWIQCARMIFKIGQGQDQNKEATEAFYSFSRKYQRSVRQIPLQSGKGI